MRAVSWTLHSVLLEELKLYRILVARVECAAL